MAVRGRTNCRISDCEAEEVGPIVTNNREKVKKTSRNNSHDVCEVYKWWDKTFLVVTSKLSTAVLEKNLLSRRVAANVMMK